jgi:lipid-A-disaccharide synthase
VEAALLGTPMVTFYRVSPPSWVAGKLLVRVPFYSMVNLIAGRRIVPELMQSQMTGEALASEAGRLLGDPAARAQMCTSLEEVRRKLSLGPLSEPGESGRLSASAREPLSVSSPQPLTAAARAASIVQEILEGQLAHVS